MKRKQFLLLMSIFTTLLSILFTFGGIYILEPSKMNGTIIFAFYMMCMFGSAFWWDEYFKSTKK